MSNKESGLNIHMSKEHAKIEQLDGNVENFESDEVISMILTKILTMNIGLI